jgi:hypothetical protein
MKWFLTLLLFIVPTANAECLKPTALSGAVLDTVTTIAVISKPGVVEVNPLGVVGSAIGKGITLYYMKDADENTKKDFDKWAGSLWTAAAVNNIAVFMGSSIAFPLGILSFIILKDIKCEEEYIE